MDQENEANLSANTAQNFVLVCMRFLASTGSTSHLLSFVFNVTEQWFLTWALPPPMGRC